MLPCSPSSTQNRGLLYHRFQKFKKQLTGQTHDGNRQYQIDHLNVRIGQQIIQRVCWRVFGINVHFDFRKIGQQCLDGLARTRVDSFDLSYDSVLYTDLGNNDAPRYCCTSTRPEGAHLEQRCCIAKLSIEYDVGVQGMTYPAPRMATETGLLPFMPSRDAILNLLFDYRGYRNVLLKRTSASLVTCSRTTTFLHVFDFSVPRFISNRCTFAVCGLCNRRRQLSLSVMRKR